MKHIGVFTSGGDSPGMNACIRAVVRSSIYYGCKVSGIYEGYSGLIKGDIREFKSSDVSNIIQRGGTILRSARSEEFRTQEGRKKAFDQINKNELDGIVAIGGDGTFTGAHIFEKEFGVKMIGIPGTIDNDLYGTDWCIGYDTALNTVVQAVDRLRDTADAHNRMFIVEVMGKDAGFIALRSGIACGAEAILIPETPTFMNELLDRLEKGWARKKSSNIIIVAEGDDFGGAQKVAETIKKSFNKYEIRISVLGHIQRGGSPTAMDRVLASQLGHGAVKALVEGKSSQMIGMVNNKLAFTSFKEAVKHNQFANQHLLQLTEVLSI